MITGFSNYHYHLYNCIVHIFLKQLLKEKSWPHIFSHMFSRIFSFSLLFFFDILPITKPDPGWCCCVLFVAFLRCNKFCREFSDLIFGSCLENSLQALIKPIVTTTYSVSVFFDIVSYNCLR